MTSIAIPAPATAAGAAGTHRPIVHIGCPTSGVSLCRTRHRLPAEAPAPAGIYCVVCVDLAQRPACPDCGGEHRIPEGARRGR